MEALRSFMIDFPLVSVRRTDTYPFFHVVICRLWYGAGVVPIYRLLFGSRVPVVVRTPEDRFRGLEAVGYNFPPNYMNT
jgi:hypothetical protein